MSIKKINPHHFQLDENASLSNLSFVSQTRDVETNQQNKSSSMQIINRKMRLLSLIVGSIYTKRIINAFRNIKSKPIRAIYLKKRLVQTFLSLVRRSQYNKTFESFQTIKRFYIQKQNQAIFNLKNLLCKAKLSSIKIISILSKAKQQENIQFAFRKINLFSKSKKLLINEKHRKAFRKLIEVKNKVVRKYFVKVRSSKYLIERRIKLQTIFKVIKELRNRFLKVGIDKLRRNLYIIKQNAISSEIKLIESRISSNQDQQITFLKQKQSQLQKNLVDVKKQKQQISQAYQIEVRQAQSKNSQIQNKIKLIKQQNQSLVYELKQIDEKLKEQYSLDQIFQMFYNNLLLYISQNKNKILLKSQMIEAITKPLIPVEIPLEKLKQQNKVLKDLLSEYILIYGQKAIEDKPLQIPYEYLIKQSQVMYKMMASLLPRLQYNKKQVSELRQTLESVESVVKQFKN